MAELQVFFAMHDVTPFHQRRLERAEALFTRWGIRKALYLLVPNYHGAAWADRDPAFRQWCLARRPFEVNWFLHGYFHHVADPAATVEQLEAAGQPRITGGRPAGDLRADEGEFAQLRQRNALNDRLEHGSQVFERCLGFKPAGFVAPKWMGSPELPRALADRSLTWTEDDRTVLHLPSGSRLLAPVITWATRAWWRRQTSLWGCPLLGHWWRNSRRLRIAVHPFDFDHPRIVDSIERIVAAALERRTQAFYDDLPAAELAQLAA